MECEICGSEVSEGALACPRCGSPVTKKPGPGKQEAAPESRDPELEVPLAPLEEDFIALAEERAGAADDTREAVSTEAGVPTTPRPETAAILADQEVPPGAKDQPGEVTLELGNALVGGYKGPEAPSVAGAGYQTADDPFGLNVDEVAPPVSGQEGRKGRSPHLIRNIVVIVITIIVAGGVAAVGVYYGFLQDTGPDTGDPVGVVEQYFRYVVASDSSGMEEVALPGVALTDRIDKLLIPYEKKGISPLSLKEYKGQTVSAEGGQAQVRLETVEIEVSRARRHSTFWR